MHYLKQILHQIKQTFIREVIVDHCLADNIYEMCTQHGNDIFLVADENTAKLLNKNIFNKIPHLIISGKVVGFDDLGMEAIYEFEVEDMPVTVAVDTKGESVHKTGPQMWFKRINAVEA